MTHRLITAPDDNTVAILLDRMSLEMRKKLGEEKIGAVALIQDHIPNIIYYADIAAKASDVVVAEIVGNCPKTMTTIAILGKVESVNTAMDKVLAEIKR